MNNDDLPIDFVEALNGLLADLESGIDKDELKEQINTFKNDFGFLLEQ